jgi:type IX secretion system PorP/SprF family membrane protein
MKRMNRHMSIRSVGRYLRLMIIVITSTFSANAQDIHFSQFFEAPLLRNPSLAGIFTGDVRVQAVYRSQWSSVTDAYKSTSINGEYKMPVRKGNDFITIGLQLLYDKAGTAGLTTTTILPAINYHKALRDDKTMYLSFGFMGGIVQKSIDRSKITTDQTYNSGTDGETFGAPNYLYPDGSVGVSFNNSFGENQENTFFIGAAYHHLNKPKNSFYHLSTAGINPKTVISSGVRVRVDDYRFFTLQADQSVQGSFNETIGGAMYSVKIGDSPENPKYIIHGGAFLRWKDALIPVVKIDYHPFAVALSYDVNVSQLKTASMSRGGFELSISYAGFLDRDNSTRDKVLCPHF